MNSTAIFFTQIKNYQGFYGKIILIPEPELDKSALLKALLNDKKMQIVHTDAKDIDHNSHFNG